MEAAVKSYNACCEDGFGWSSAPDDQELFRINITKAMAHLSVYEEIRHSFAMQQFIVATTKAPLEDETNAQIQANIMTTYENVMCVPSIFRQLVYGSGVFLPVDMIDKPLLHFVGRHLALKNGFQWVYANVIAKCCLQSTFEVENRFLLQHIVLDECLTKEAKANLIENRKDLMRRIERIEAGMHFNPDLTLPRVIGARLVHELFTTLLSIFSNGQDSSDRITKFTLDVLALLHEQSSSKELLIQLKQLEACVVAIQTVQDATLPALLELISNLFRVSPLYKQAFLNLKLTNALVHRLATATEVPLVTVLNFLYELARNDGKVVCVLVEETALLRQVFGVLQLPIVFTPTFHCLALHRPSASQLDAIIAATKVLCAITTSSGAAITVFDSLELMLSSMVPALKSISNDRTILRTILDLLAVTESQQLRHPLLALTQHFARANPADTVTRLCDHGGVLMLFECVFDSHAGTQELALDILRLLIAVSSGEKPCNPPNEPRKSLMKFEKTPTERYSMAIPMTFDSKRRVALRPHDRPKNLVDAPNRNEPVALILSRIAFFGAVYPIYDHRLDDMTLGNQTTEVDFVWIEDMLRRLVVFGRLSFAELHVVSRALVVHRVLPSRSIINEPGLYIITTGKVEWQLENASCGTHFLEKGCMVGVSTCLNEKSINKERATSLSAVVNLFLSQSFIDTKLSPQIQDKLYSSMRNVAGMFTTTKSPIPCTYLDKFKRNIMQPARIEFNAKLLANLLDALAQTKETLKVNVWLLVHLINDVMSWYDKVPTELRQSIAHFTMSLLQAQDNPQVHCIVLKLGENFGARGAKFFAQTWQKPLDQLPLMSDVIVVNRLAAVLGILCQYKCLHPTKCKLSKRLCMCTLTARRVVLEHFDLSFLDLILSLCENQFVTARLDLDAIYSLLSKLFKTNRYRLASYLRHIEPNALLSSFLADIVSLAEDDSPNATKLLGKLCRHPYFHNALVELPGVHQSTSVWLQTQIDTVKSGFDFAALQVLEMLSLLCCTNSPSMQSHLGSVFNQILHDNVFQLLTISLQQTSGEKSKLVAIRALRNFCVANRLLSLPQSLDNYLDKHQDLINKVFALFSEVASPQSCPNTTLKDDMPNPFVHHYGTKLIVVAEVVEYCCSHHLNSGEDYFSVITASLKHFISFLSVPVLSCFLENAADRIAGVFRSALVSATFLIDQYHAIAYGLLDALTLAHANEHEGVLRILVHLVSFLSKFEWFKALAPTPGRVNLLQAFVAVIMEVASLEWDSVKHASALCALSLCQSPICMQEITREIYITKICSHLHCGFIGMHGFVGLLALLCKTKELRPRLIPILPALINVLPFMVEHHCLAAAATVLWALWKTVRKSSIVWKTIAFNDDTMGALLVLLQPKVPWFESSPVHRIEAGAGAISELLRISHPPAWQLAIIVQTCSSHLKVIDPASGALVYQLVKALNWILHHHKRLYTHFRYKREVSLSAICAMAPSMKRNGPSRICSFTTCLLRLEQSQELRLKVQDELAASSEVWRSLVYSVLKSTDAREVIVGLEVLRVICHNHEGNTADALELIVIFTPLVQNYGNEEADKSLRILEAICSIISSIYRLCPAQARVYAIVVDKMMNLVLQAVCHWKTSSNLWCRLVITTCRAYTRLLHTTPCLNTVALAVNVLKLLPVAQPRLLCAIYILCYNILIHKSIQQVPHDLQCATVSYIVESLRNCSRTIVRIASWRLLAYMAKSHWNQLPIAPLALTKILCLGFPSTEKELKQILSWLLFDEYPHVVISYAQASILHIPDEVVQSLWLVVLHQVALAYPTSNEFFINMATLRTMVLSTNSLVRMRSLEYIATGTIDPLDSIVVDFMQSVAVKLLNAFQTTLNQFDFWDRACGSYASFVLQLVNTPQAFILFSDHFAPLYPLLVTHLNAALSKNYLDDAASILNLVFCLLCGVSMLKSSADISKDINIALLKQTSLPLVLYALQTTAHFADKEPYNFIPFSTLEHTRLSNVILCHAIKHVNNASSNLNLSRSFFSTIARILNPKVSPLWFYEELVAKKFHIKLLELLLELKPLPELMIDCLLVQAQLFTCSRTARDLSLAPKIISIAGSSSKAVATAALTCLYQLYRRADCIDFDNILMLLDEHVASEATFGLVAYILKCPQAKAISGALWRVVDKHLTSLNVNELDTLVQCKFLYGIVYYQQQLLNQNALTFLFQCTSKPCSKTSIYALESLVIAIKYEPSIATIACSSDGVKSFLYQHFLYGMAEVSPHLRGIDSLRKTQSALQLLCVDKSLDLLHAILDQLKQEKNRQKGELFSILLNLTQFGPDIIQVSAMSAALKYFNVFRCEWFIFDGTDRVLKFIFQCLIDERLQPLTIKLLLAMSNSKRLQLSILDHPTGISTIFTFLEAPIEFTGELWQIIANLASAGEYAKPLSKALIDARQWLTLSKVTILEQQSIAMTLARLSQSPKLSFTLISFQDWLMVFEREAQIDSFLLDFQHHLIVHGLFSRDNQMFEMLVQYLVTVSVVEYSSFKSLELMQIKIFQEFVRLIVSFYLLHEDSLGDIKFNIHENPRLHLTLPKWLGCLGIPYKDDNIYKQIFILLKNLCRHQNSAIALSCWECILHEFQEMTQKCCCGCYLFTQDIMIELIDLQLPTCTIEQCTSIFTSFRACARIRLLSATFCNGDRSPWTVFCATTVRALHHKGVKIAIEPFLLALALLSENKIFLQSALLRGKPSAVFSMLLYILHYSLSSPMAYSNLAAQIFVRLCTVSTIAILQKTFFSCVDELGHLGMTKHAVAQAMIYAIYLTNFESEMHLKVLVRLIHSVLLRMVAIGRIDKGIPTLLHDNGLESLFLCTKAFMGEFEHQISIGNKVDWAMLSHWVQALREEHTKYCLEGYEALYGAFMSANHNPQLNVAISSTKHAVMCYQTLHYTLHQISDGILHIAALKGQTKEVLALGLHEFFHRLECIGEWVILCLQNPDVDVGYYTNQIEALCTCVNALLPVHGQIKLTANDKIDQKYPIRIALDKLHLRSWMWALLGTKPYVRLSIGAKHAYFGCSSSAPGKLSCRCKHKCGKYVHVDDGVLYVISAEALQSMDIQVWMYLPWWPIDICIGRASASFPIATGIVPIEFYPEQRDKMRFDIMQPYGELHLLVSIVEKELPSSSTFPFSTCGSKSLRTRIDRLFMSFVSKIKALWHRFNAKGTRVVAVTGRTNRQFGSSNHGSHCIEAHLSELQLILSRCTEKDKLIGSYEKQQAFAECKAIMDKLLDSNPGSFNSMVPFLVDYLTDSTTRPVWDRIWTSIQQTIKLYMPLGLSYLKSHLHVHNEPSVAHFHHHRAKYNEVSTGIDGLNYSAQQLKQASILRGLRPRFMKLPSIKPEGFHGHSDVAAIAQVIKRHRRTQWQQVVMPHMSLFTLSEARFPSWCELDQMVPPDTMNHFFIQPLERLQVLIAVARFSTSCFGHSQLARLSIQYSPVTVQATRASLSHLADRLKAWLIDQVPVAPPLTLVAPALNPRTASRSTTTHLLKHMATMKRSQAPIMGAQSTRSLERRRKHHLATFGDLDPFDGYSKLQALNARASNMPSFVYKQGFVADALHIIAWIIIITTVWRLSMTLETLRDAAQTYNTILTKPAPTLKSLSTLSPRKRRACMQTLDAGSLPEPDPPDKMSSNVLRTEKELRYFLVIAELKGVVMDLIYIWPSENGKIGLGDFWSSLYYTVLAFGLPFFFYYFISPMTSDSNQLAIVSCWYGIFWVVLAFLSIVSVTRNIPGFNQTRRVDSINMTEFPSCLKNYLAILNILWELIQLNTIPWQVWDASYAVHKIASLVTIDWEAYGYQVYLQFNVFEIKQQFAFVCLIMWLVTLKAANKFKSMNWLNYFITFLLPSTLSSILFMFLSEQYIYSVACFRVNAPTNTTMYVLWSNNAIECWTPLHWRYAIVGMLGMSLFIPLAVLSYGSHQLAFPQLDLDIQTSPLFAMVGQLVKGLMIGAKTFFVTDIRFYLAISIAGDVVLFAAHYRFPKACSTWHVRAAKLLIYTLSLWSAICAMITTFADHAIIPLSIMYSGHAFLFLVFGAILRYRVEWLGKH
ncbi:hypothetical protein THRCLA_07722 [Thraustotheca clavata]|uniref:Uncharacterized protein n=1 Tax=Thraustotheca clavata TaxID=74557 RepID=A0A1V9ZCF6_9STRA|nr:hypothetical protein THRCLA_07722 [Thraustotheca clavata]